MAIKDYIRPKLEVYQQLEITQSEVGDKMAACIVGADYDLYRYGYETIAPTAYELIGGSMMVPLVYERIPSLNYKLDEATIATYGEDMLAKVGKAATGTTLTCEVDDSDLFVIRTKDSSPKKYFSMVDTTEASLTAANAALVDVAATTAAYAVQAGDIILLPNDKTAKVVELLGKKIPANVAAHIPHGLTVTSTAASITSGMYALTKDTTILVTITDVAEKNYSYVITDTEGLMPAVSGTAIGGQLEKVFLGTSGVHMSATITEASEGDYIAIPCTAASVSSTQFDGLLLDTTAVDVGDAEDEVNISGACKSYTGVIDGWTKKVTQATSTTEAELTLEGTPALMVNGKGYPFISEYGSIYPSFRVMIQPQATEDKYTITSIADIQRYFGTIAVENDLAYACYCALDGSAGRQLYALRVTNDTADAYTAALNKVETDASTYNFCVLSQDAAVIEASIDYVNKRSEPDFKRWCRVLVGVDSPGEYIVAGRDNEGTLLKANFGKIKNSTTAATHVMQLTSTMKLDLLAIPLNGGTVEILPGDQIESLASGDRYTIVEVKNANTVTIAGGPATDSTNIGIRIWKADTAANAGAYVAAMASGINLRRCSLVWSDHAIKNIDGITTVMSNKYLAATIAGIGSAVVPQAPITHTEITTVDSAVRMYTMYTQKDLDNIAKDGVLIVTQDAKNLPCYIRHQLTTETDKGVMYYEESCTRNLDNISYAVTDVLEKYIGRANVTASALRAIEIDLIAVFNSFQDDSPSDLIGPSLIDWKNLTIEQDKVFKDRVICKVDLYLPLPLNNIKMYEMAYIADVTL